jgi:hypothetical protein
MFAGRLITHCGTITWPACLTDFAVPDHFLWVYVKSKVYETHPAKIHDLKQRIWKCILECAFHRNCRSVLNDMVVTYKVSDSNSNDSDGFSWTWNVLANVNQIFPLCLKMLFNFKNHQMFLKHPA